jgi:hypothetical protein
MHQCLFTNEISPKSEIKNLNLFLVILESFGHLNKDP